MKDTGFRRFLRVILQTIMGFILLVPGVVVLIILIPLIAIRDNMVREPKNEEKDEQK